jgi:murein L,D-transpeptidase YafK
MLTYCVRRLFRIRIFSLLCAIIIFSIPAQARDLPSGPRVRQAIARQKHRLQNLLADKNFRWGAPIYLRIFKSEKKLEVWLLKKRRYHLFKCYPICTYGGMGLGPKTHQGDGYAPEGFYDVGPEQMNPFSRFYLSFNLGYPNAYDRYRGRTGSALMVHGNCVSIGCFAMTDSGIEDIYLLAHAALTHGQPGFSVHIFPFEMRAENMKHHRNSSWFAFWNNLKQGYDRFQIDGHVPPAVTVKNGHYYFKPGRLPRVRQGCLEHRPPAFGDQAFSAS